MIHEIHSDIQNNYRIYWDTRTLDVIIQAAIDGGFDGEYFEGDYYEVILRGKSGPRIDGDLENKRNVIRAMRNYTAEEVEAISLEAQLDGILSDYAVYYIGQFQANTANFTPYMMVRSLYCPEAHYNYDSDGANFDKETE